MLYFWHNLSQYYVIRHECYFFPTIAYFTKEKIWQAGLVAVQHLYINESSKIQLNLVIK